MFFDGRRRFLIQTTLMVQVAASARAAGPLSASGPAPQRRWYEAALAMQKLAESWGDQPYGAVIVLQGQPIGDGPSRVVQRGDLNAHAEREAIRDAQQRLGRTSLAGSVLYSTSRPCAQCQAVAAAAGVSRMYFGEQLEDAGVPKA